MVFGFGKASVGRPRQADIDTTQSRWPGSPAIPHSTTTNIFVQGVQIPQTGEDYKPIVFEHLRVIGSFPAGRALYEALSEVPGKRQLIVYGGPMNNQAAGTPAGYKLLRKYHDSMEWESFAAELRAAIGRSRKTVAQLGRELYDVLIPTWTDGLQPSVFRTTPVPGAPLDPAGERRPMPPVPADYIGQKLTDWSAAHWANGRPSLDEMDAICLVLQTNLADGPGASTRINYDPHKANGRPPVVGLYHELVHALYNATGGQLGREDSLNEGNGGRLFEAMAVGLGPFGAAAVSENAFRANLNVPLRPTYP